MTTASRTAKDLMSLDEDAPEWQPGVRPIIRGYVDGRTSLSETT